MEEQLVLIVYSCWFALGLARQWPGAIRETVGRCDFFHLVPHWGYFAAPGGYDFTFVRRFRQEDNSYTDWEQIDIAKPRSRWAFLWHPQLSSALTARAFAIKAGAINSRAQREGFLDSAKYGLLVAYLSTNVLVPNAVAMQFIVYASGEHDGQRRRTMAFVSDFHDL